MLATFLAQAGDWASPTIDWHALAPEIVLAIGINLILALDLQLAETKKWMISTITGFVLLAAFVPVVTLAVIGDDTRSLFDGRYVIDDYALVLKGLFLLAAYVVVLMSQTELEEGGYYQGEFYVLMLCSVLGMVMMASARDLVSIFVALELLSIPGYMMAAWNKRNRHSNEAGVKYYLMGVFASAVLLYGMSLLFGVTGSTLLTDIGASLADGDLIGLEVVAIVFVICGFAFKVSAVPFHQWAPDTYEGAPTPVTAFFSVASKSAGFVALMTLIFVAFPGADEVYEPLMWVMAALTMTIGNVLALRQTNIVRMLAYSSISQGGFILMPLAFAGNPDATGSAMNAVMVYLLVYAFMNLGAFAIVIAVSRKTTQRRDLLLRWPVRLRAGPRGRDDDLLRLARRHPAARWLVRQVQRLQGRARCRHHARLRARRDRRRQHRDRCGVLHAGAARGVDGRGTRRRRQPGQPARSGRRCVGDHRRSARSPSACSRTSSPESARSTPSPAPSRGDPHFS
jgi:NADH-quinone oxidoreductase subunit N